METVPPPSVAQLVRPSHCPPWTKARTVAQIASWKIPCCRVTRSALITRPRGCAPEGIDHSSPSRYAVRADESPPPQTATRLGKAARQQSAASHVPQRSHPSDDELPPLHRYRRWYGIEQDAEPAHATSRDLGLNGT
jgi:hypothetical protein